MKRNTPLITLLVGAALGVVLLVSNMLATPSGAPVSYSAAAASASVPRRGRPCRPASGPTESVRTAARPPPRRNRPRPRGRRRPPRAPSPEPTRTTPTRATYTARVGGGGGSVAVAVHGGKAIAYVCNGSTVEGWMRGTVENGKLVLTGKNNAHLTATYHPAR